jgi:hypothetical protein
MMEVLVLVLLVLVTNLASGGIVAAFLLGRNDRLQLPEWPLVLTGLALGPFLTTLVLYYAMALWHGLPVAVLVLLPLVLFLFLAGLAGTGRGRLLQLMAGLPARLKDRSLWPFVLGTLFLLGITAVFLVNKPLVDHDVLEYGVQGRIFLRDRAIVYERFHFDAASGFHYVGLHGFSFPLLFTWEGLWGTLWGVRTDVWARSITMWYAWLLIAFCWSLLRRVDRWGAVFGGIALTAPIGFLFLMTIYHLDSYRIFFFTAALGAYVALLQRPSPQRLLLFAALAGAQAFIHSVGAILAGVMVAVLLFALPQAWGTRVQWLLRAVGVLLLLGAVHYVADVFKGTGWIFQDLIWY